MTKKRVVIVGGGFAGINAAKKLRNKFKVTLIDEKDYFEYTPSILRALVNPNHKGKIRVSYNNNLNFVDIKTESVIKCSNTKVFTAKNTYYFDFAVICAGSDYGVISIGIDAVKAGNSADLMKSYTMLKSANYIIIIGGGLVGVELAAEIIENYPKKQVTIIHGLGNLIDRNPEKARNYAFDFLSNKGVKVVLNERMISQNSGFCITNKNSKFRYDLVYNCVGVSPRSELLKNSFAASLDKKGSIRVNKYLQLDNIPNIFAAGDVNSIIEEKLAQNAEKHGNIAAENIIRIENNALLKEYTSQKRPIVISLGKLHGIFIYGNFVFTGIFPGILKNVIELWEMFKLKYL